MCGPCNEREKKGSSCLLHNTLDQFLNSCPKLAIFSLAFADLVGNKAHELNIQTANKPRREYQEMLDSKHLHERSCT